jgi:hypothetical protein
MTTLADKLLPDALWQRIQLVLPPSPSRARRGETSVGVDAKQGRDPGLAVRSPVRQA